MSNGQEAEALELAWERWTDGRVWRLKRGRDFPRDVDATTVAAAAGDAALRMGKAVLTTRDPGHPEKYCWLQFADGTISSSEPCPCGNRTLLQLHTNFARCKRCQALLIVVPDTGDPETGMPTRPRKQPKAKAARPPKPARAALSGYRDIHLEQVPRAANYLRYRGYARETSDEFVFIFVRFAVDDEADLAGLDSQALRMVPGSVRRIKLEEMKGLVDPEELLNRAAASWDIVLD